VRPGAVAEISSPTTIPAAPGHLLIDTARDEQHHNILAIIVVESRAGLRAGVWEGAQCYVDSGQHEGQAEDEGYEPIGAPRRGRPAPAVSAALSTDPCAGTTAVDALPTRRNAAQMHDPTGMACAGCCWSASAHAYSHLHES